MVRRYMEEVKNLGFDVVKPDRHLLRLASSLGFDSPEELCAEIAYEFGEPAAVVDIVLWRYCTLLPFHAKMSSGQPTRGVMRDPYAS